SIESGVRLCYFDVETLDREMETVHTLYARTHALDFCPFVIICKRHKRRILPAALRTGCAFLRCPAKKNRKE
ncbi:MAG TPA: hypothetical protein H9883_08040, partial [Candidatus Ruthenibacterium merdigallinarum]|nr:hypothetical protein [Candidatus Ruthenibacterium merdigallinarum]